jgi:hypothetical protein
MKYVVSWTFRQSSNAQDNEASLARNLAVFSKWTVPEGMILHQFVGRADNMGGFSVIETDDLTSVALITAKFAPYADFQVFPVLDAEPSVAVMHEAAQFRDSIT